MSFIQIPREFFEFLERKIVFVVSRLFFWILCFFAGLQIIIAVLLFLYNVIPPTKEKVAEPKMPPEVTINLADVKEAMKPPAVTSKIEIAKPSSEEVKPAISPPDPLESALYTEIDKLKTYFPEPLYAWKTIRGRVKVGTDWWGEPIFEERVIKSGLERHLNKVLSLYDERQKQIDVVKEILSIIPSIDVNERGKALQVWADLRVRRERERREEVSELEDQYKLKLAEAERKYSIAKSNKTKGLVNSLLMLGSGIVGIAIIGLFLSLLAIERNTQILRKIVEKNES